MQTRDQIIAALRTAGADEETISKALAELEPTTPENDALGKSLGDLRAAFDREHAGRDEDLAKSLDEAADLVDAVTKGSDLILAEFRAQNDALAKGMVALINTSRDERAELRSLIEEVRELRQDREEQDERIAKALSVPQEPRGLSGATPVPTPSERVLGGAPEAGDLINKALTELQSADEPRKRELSTAISRLNSGFAAHAVAQEFGLSA